MKTKKDIVDNWLPRYTGRELKDFSKYILLTNFEYYLELFSELYQVPIVGADKTMPNVSCNGITLVNFGMGSPNAATILDLLSAIEPEAVLFIGKCGGIKEKNSVGDYILPIAAIKGEGTPHSGDLRLLRRAHGHHFRVRCAVACRVRGPDAGHHAEVPLSRH